MKMKKVALLVSAAVLVIAVSVGGTLAYLTSTDTKTNVVTIGNVEIKVDETYTPVTDAEPGVVYDKVVNIKNTTTTTNDAYVRAKITYNSKYVTLGETGTGWTLAKGAADETGLVTDIYTYNTKLAPSTSTATAAFSTFTLNTDNVVQGLTTKTLDIVVLAEGIQTGGFDSPAAAFAKFK
ncbi:MAG: TasA family protein [Pseudoflavonifractor sp.]